MWTCGIQLWEGTAAKRHLAETKAVQSIMTENGNKCTLVCQKRRVAKRLKKIPSVEEKIQLHAGRWTYIKTRTTNHPNSLAETLYTTGATRRLKKKHPQDLLRYKQNFCKSVNPHVTRAIETFLPNVPRTRVTKKKKGNNISTSKCL